jgi:hypothetical protein
MAVVINEFEAVAEPQAPGAAQGTTPDRRAIEPRRVMPALTRLASRARRTWAH